MILKNKEYLLQHVRPYADYIADINGESCEVILHDISDVRHSIIYVRNGYITGRKIGDGVTQYALELIQKIDYTTQESVVNYLGFSRTNNKKLRSSTLFIKKDEELIGLLCINIDITRSTSAIKDLQEMFMLPECEAEVEYFDDSIENLVDTVIEESLVLWDNKTALSELDSDENPIKFLYEKGVFNYKGSVKKVATMYHISTQTVYRYVSMLEKGTSVNSKGN